MCQQPEPAVTIVKDYQAMSHLGADIVARTMAESPGCTIAIPTGNTPLGMFDELVGRRRREQVDFTGIHFQCLDEYVGIAEDHPVSLTGWLWRSFFGPAGIGRDYVHALPATAPDLDTAAARFEDELAARGGLALAVLGLGANGHVAYNEPGSTATSRTRTLELTPESIEQAAGYWSDAAHVPRIAMTIGVGTLLEARRIVLLVSGSAKAAILHRVLHDPMTDDLPASWLRLAGERLTIIADEAAARLTVENSQAGC